MQAAPQFSAEPVGSQEFAALLAAEAAALAQRAASAAAAPPPHKAARLANADAAPQMPACADAAGAEAREPLRAMQQPAEAAAHAPRAPPEAAPSFPPLRYQGRVVVASTAAEVDAAVAAVYAGRHAVVGWDIEWRVSYQRGAVPEKTALMQLALPGGAAGPPCVHLLRVCMSGVTPALAALLADASVSKTGCAARNDAHKVGRDFALRMDGVVDLSELAGTRIVPLQRWSLAALVQRLFGCALPKPSSLRTGAWDARELSAEQVAYAALDAWASLRVHVALAQLPELPPPPPSTLPPLQPLGFCGGGCTFVPALPLVTALAPAKQAVLAQHCAGASVDQIAAQRGIQRSTVENYLSDAMCVCLRLCTCMRCALTSSCATAPRATRTTGTALGWMTPPRRSLTPLWRSMRRQQPMAGPSRACLPMRSRERRRSALRLRRRLLRAAGSRRSRRACPRLCLSPPFGWSSRTESAERRWTQQPQPRRRRRTMRLPDE